MLAIGTVMLLQLTTLNYVGTLSDSLHSPARVCVAPDGRVLVADPSNNTIVRFDAAGTFLGTWPVADGPIGIAAHTDGRYFVALRDTAKVAIYSNTFTLLGYLGAGNQQVHFVQPTDIDVATNTGNIYVVDGEGDHVYGFGPDGSLVLSLGTRGSGNGQFRYPSALAVDETNGRLIVADHDNFRIQVFTTNGTFIRSFGDRNKYPNNGPSEGWVPRTQGLTVDAQGRIFVADALMSTVRQFDPNGVELGKLLHYGKTTPGDLWTPCDLILSNSGARLYVVSTNTSGVEMYDVGGLKDLRGRHASIPSGGAQGSGLVFESPSHDAQEVAESTPPFSGEGIQDGDRTAYAGPHIIDSPIICGRCHGIRSLPGGHEGLVEGQSALCMSCHTTGGQALSMPIHQSDQATSHRIGVPAVNSAVGSLGPMPGGPLVGHLDNGNMKCATCHDQHQMANSPYLRKSATNSALCKDCHRGTGAPADHSRGEHGSYDCLTCHDPHSTSSNLHQIRTKINGVDITFTDDSIAVGPGAFVNADPNVKGLCEACHVYPATVPPHDTATDACTSCHSHSSGFQAPLGAGPFVDATTCGACHSNQYGEWTTTLHEQATADVLNSGHFMPTCLACHTTGYGAGGFVPNDPDPASSRFANVQCESCHGAGLGPKFQNPIDGEACATCHGQSVQWEISGHADANSPAFNDPVGPGRTSCARCHTGLGYIDFSEGVPEAQRRTSKQILTCAVCHDPHDNTGSSHQLRIYNQVNLPYGTVLNNMGESATCMSCHNARYVRSGTRYTTHHSPATEMLLGFNGVAFGYTIDSSAHGSAATCVGCHMAPTPGTPHNGQHEPGEDEVGAHTFGMIYHSPTPGGPDDGAENVANACGTCHTGLTTYNRTAGGDYDGDGVVEGIQDEVQGLVDLVLAQILATGAIKTSGNPGWDLTHVPANKLTLVRDSIWNWTLVTNDMSLGVHNTGYAVGLLQVTYRQLAGVNVPGAALRYH